MGPGEGLRYWCGRVSGCVVIVGMSTRMGYSCCYMGGNTCGWVMCICHLPGTWLGGGWMSRWLVPMSRMCSMTWYGPSMLLWGVTGTLEWVVCHLMWGGYR